MPRKQSAGTLLYRPDGASADAIEVLLVHASGNYNRRAPWGIPKGLPEEGEALEDAARRETLEETGVDAGSLRSLGFIDYTKSRKRIHAFTGPAPADAVPRCASWEVDHAEFLPIAEARRRIHPDQAPFLGRLLEMLADEDGRRPPAPPAEPSPDNPSPSSADAAKSQRD